MQSKTRRQSDWSKDAAPEGVTKTSESVAFPCTSWQDAEIKSDCLAQPFNFETWSTMKRPQTHVGLT